MRHRVYGKKLGRNKNERTALFKGLVQALLIHGTIQTSQTKAQAIKGLFDKIVNLAKNKNTHRLLSAFLTQKDLEERLIKEIAPKLSDRTSGYISTVNITSRQGDNTRMVRMSIIGSEKLEPIKKIKKQKSKIKTETQKPENKKAVKVIKPARKVAKKE